MPRSCVPSLQTEAQQGQTKRGTQRGCRAKPPTKPKGNLGRRWSRQRNNKCGILTRFNCSVEKIEMTQGGGKILNANEIYDAFRD